MPDLKAHDPLDIVVVDENSHPVFDAEVSLLGMRSATDRGSWYAYRGEKPSARTDARGRARLEAWTWVNVDGRTRALDLQVLHPDHPPFRDDSFAVGPGEHTVRLAPGTRVIVRAWTGSPARPVTKIAIQLEPDADLPPEAWRLEGSYKVTARLAPGLHSIQVSSSSAGPQLFSEVVEFTLSAGETKELSVELLPAETLEGRLSDDVPRPVVDGHVFAAVRRADFTDARETIFREFQASVSADGTFSIPNVPRGRAYLFVLARGWCSPLVKADSAQEAGTRFSRKPSPAEEARALAELGRRALVLQHTMLPQPEHPLTIAMVETGVVELVVRNELGSPIADVKAGVSPNISVPEFGSMLVPWRSWTTPTDSQGIARIEDVPPQDNLWTCAQSDRWRLRSQDRRSPPTVSVKPGATAHIDLIVEPNDPTKK